MKNILIMVALAVSSTAFAAEVDVARKGFGTGTPAPMKFGNAGVENAKIVDSYPGILHAPQYMPNYPTAAVIWPRVVEVPCTKAANGDLTCEGYEYSPSMGRAEYLFIAPSVKEAPKPVEKVVPVIVERKVFVEVPAKKTRE